VRVRLLALARRTGHFARVATDGARVKISRSAHGYRDSLRRYKVLIDGVEVGRVKRGETVETIVGPGHHTLSIVIDWITSELTFDVGERDAVHFLCSPGGSCRNAPRDLKSGAQWVSITEAAP